jgi:hypothetical protein
MTGSDPAAIVEAFNSTISHWEIRLPPNSVETRGPGHIFQAGWHIGWIWGAADGEDFLEYFAQHRMTNDRHYRIWTSGRVEALPAPGPTLLPAGTSEIERARLVQQGHRSK